MKVSELIAELSNCSDPEAEVHFAYNYGDHARTTVAPAIATVDEGFVKYSDYHRMDAIIDCDLGDDEVVISDPNVKAVVVLWS